jgi:hypothetical protein
MSSVQVQVSAVDNVTSVISEETWSLWKNKFTESLGLCDSKKTDKKGKNAKKKSGKNSKKKTSSDDANDDDVKIEPVWQLQIHISAIAECHKGSLQVTPVSVDGNTYAATIYGMTSKQIEAEIATANEQKDANTAAAESDAATAPTGNAFKPTSEWHYTPYFTVSASGLHELCNSTLNLELIAEPVIVRIDEPEEAKQPTEAADESSATPDDSAASKDSTEPEQEVQVPTLQDCETEHVWSSSMSLSDLVLKRKLWTQMWLSDPRETCNAKVLVHADANEHMSSESDGDVMRQVSISVQSAERIPRTWISQVLATNSEFIKAQEAASGKKQKKTSKKGGAEEVQAPILECQIVSDTVRVFSLRDISYELACTIPVSADLKNTARFVATTNTIVVETLPQSDTKEELDAEVAAAEANSGKKGKAGGKKKKKDQELEEQRLRDLESEIERSSAYIEWNLHGEVLLAPDVVRALQKSPQTAHDKDSTVTGGIVCSMTRVVTDVSVEPAVSKRLADGQASFALASVVSSQDKTKFTHACRAYAHPLSLLKKRAQEAADTEPDATVAETEAADTTADTKHSESTADLTAHQFVDPFKASQCVVHVALQSNEPFSRSVALPKPLQPEDFYEIEPRQAHKKPTTEDQVSDHMAYVCNIVDSIVSENKANTGSPGIVSADTVLQQLAQNADVHFEIKERLKPILVRIVQEELRHNSHSWEAVVGDGSQQHTTDVAVRQRRALLFSRLFQRAIRYIETEIRQVQGHGSSLKATFNSIAKSQELFDAHRNEWHRLLGMAQQAELVDIDGNDKAEQLYLQLLNTAQKECDHAAQFDSVQYRRQVGWQSPAYIREIVHHVNAYPSTERPYVAVTYPRLSKTYHYLAQFFARRACHVDQEDDAQAFIALVQNIENCLNHATQLNPQDTHALLDTASFALEFKSDIELARTLSRAALKRSSSRDISTKLLATSLLALCEWRSDNAEPLQAAAEWIAEASLWCCQMPAALQRGDWFASVPDHVKQGSLFPKLCAMRDARLAALDLIGSTFVSQQLDELCGSLAQSYGAEMQSLRTPMDSYIAAREEALLSNGYSQEAFDACNQCIHDVREWCEENAQDDVIADNKQTDYTAQQLVLDECTLLAAAQRIVDVRRTETEEADSEALSDDENEVPQPSALRGFPTSKSLAALPVDTENNDAQLIRDALAALTRIVDSESVKLQSQQCHHAAAAILLHEIERNDEQHSAIDWNAQAKLSSWVSSKCAFWSYLWIQQAVAQYELGNMDACNKALLKANELDKSSGRCWAYLALLSSHNPAIAPRVASDCFAYAMKTRVMDVRALKLIAAEFNRRGDWGRAEQALRAALALSEDSEVRALLALILSKRQRTQEATSQYKQAINLSMLQAQQHIYGAGTGPQETK